MITCRACGEAWPATAPPPTSRLAGDLFYTVCPSCRAPEPTGVRLTRSAEVYGRAIRAAIGALLRGQSDVALLVLDLAVDETPGKR